MTYSNYKIRRFLEILSKHENIRIEQVVNNDVLKTFKEIDPEITKLKEGAKIKDYLVLKKQVDELEKKLSKFTNSNDYGVRRLQRNILRLKGKIKRLEKP